MEKKRTIHIQNVIGAHHLQKGATHRSTSSKARNTFSIHKLGHTATPPIPNAFISCLQREFEVDLKALLG